MSGRLVVILLLMLGSNRAFAQVGFYEAGYILQGTDTIRGYVERHDEITVSKSVNFRHDLTTAEPGNYSPVTTSGFGYDKDGVHFKSVPVQIRLGNNVTTEQRFTKVLLQGYVDLYKVQLPPGEQSVILRTENTFVYVIRKEGDYYTLGQYEYRLDNTVSLNKRYIGVLKAVLTDCPSSKLNFDQLDFEDKEMVKAISAYNLCIRPDLQVSHLSYEVKPVVKHGPEVSYGKFVSPSTRIATSSHAVGLGYFFDILRPDISRSHSIRLGLSYFYTNYKLNARNTEVSISENSMRVPLMAQFNLTKNANSTTSPFLNAGMTAKLAAATKLYNADIYTFFTLGAGMYISNYRFSFLIDSENLQLRSVKIMNLAVGYRFDRRGR